MVGENNIGIRSEPGARSRVGQASRSAIPRSRICLTGRAALKRLPSAPLPAGIALLGPLTNRSGLDRAGDSGKRPGSEPLP